MGTTDPYEITRAIAALKPWATAGRHNWALVPQTSAEPYIAMVVDEQKREGVVAGRLMLFPGFGTFRDFLIARQVNDYGVEMSPLDFPHYEAVGLKNGKVELFVYEPGFVPVPPAAERSAELATLLNECYGIMLRLEENPELPLAYVDKKAMFARKEVVENVWVDGPFMLPKEDVVQQVERIELKKADCAKAKELPVFPKETWELDFVMMPTYHTAGPRKRFLYLFAAVNVENGERMVWERLSVDEDGGGLKPLWENHAQRLLDAIISWGRVPGEIHVRSGRMMRFIRPLGLQLPFKVVRHEKLPALESTIDLAVKNRKI